MKTLSKYLFATVTFCVLTLGISSPSLGQKSTGVAQINGEDVAQPADTVSPSHTSVEYDVRAMMNDRGIPYVYIKRDDRVTVTVFNVEDARVVCSWDDTLIVYVNQSKVSCR